MRASQLKDANAGQMLLATGVVLLMSLLSMAIFGVKVAGLTLPHEAASDDVIDTTDQVLETIQPLTQARMDLWMDGGLEPLEAAELGFETVHDDLLHHGELRALKSNSPTWLFQNSTATRFRSAQNWVSPTARPC